MPLDFGAGLLRLSRRDESSADYSFILGLPKNAPLFNFSLDAHGQAQV